MRASALSSLESRERPYIFVSLRFSRVGVTWKGTATRPEAILANDTPHHASRPSQTPVLSVSSPETLQNLAPLG